MKSFVALSLLSAGVNAFPWVAHAPGVDSSALHSVEKRQQAPQPGGPGSADTCPFNAQHVDAVPVKQGQYNNARGGRKGNEKGGYQVPRPDDLDHQFIAPRPGIDIRGPCPGLNVAANVSSDYPIHYLVKIFLLMRGYSMVSLHEMVSRPLMNWSMRNKMSTTLATTFLSC